ncbi:MAG: rod shape-determining protein RodA [Solirubrobacterales bacterium]
MIGAPIPAPTRRRPAARRGRPAGGQAHPRPFPNRDAGTLEKAIGGLDFALAGAAIAIIAFSAYTLGLTTREDIPGDPYFYVIRQAIYAVVGIALMLTLARIDYSRFRELRVGLYTAMVATIVLVLALGEATRGSRRWIELPFFTFQPSEPGKLLLIVTLAAFVLERARNRSEGRRTAKLLALGIAPGVIVFLAPDLGSGLVYGVITLAVLFVAGIPWKHFAVMGGVAAGVVGIVLVVAPALGTPILEPYQEERITSFLNPSEDPRDSSYQINQALIAVGSGGKTGRAGESTQSQAGFLPERHTDFIFAVVGERFGFAGAAFLLSLYALLIWRALRIVTLSKNLYGAMIAGGIAAMLMFHLFVNVGMNVGIAPVTGIPLPLMSAGGSSVIVTFMAIGILQSIYVQSQLSSRNRAPAI